MTRILAIGRQATVTGGVENKRLDSLLHAFAEEGWVVREAAPLPPRPYRQSFRRTAVFGYFLHLGKILLLASKERVSGSRIALLTGGPFYPFFLAPYLRTLGYLVVLDFRDPFFFPGADGKAPGRSNLRRWLLNQTQQLFLKAGHVIFVTTATIRNAWLVSYGSNLADKLRVVGNGYDDTLGVSIPAKVKSDRLTLGILGKFAYYSTQDWNNLLDWSNSLAQPVTIISVGNDVFPEGHDRGPTVVDKVPGLPLAAAYDKLAACDVLLVNGRDGIINAKSYDYLVVNKPVWGFYRHSNATDEFLQQFPGYTRIANREEFVRAATGMPGATLRRPDQDIRCYSRSYQGRIAVSAIQEKLDRR